MNSVEELLKRADLALYQAKGAGRNAIRFFDPKMQEVINARVALEADIRDGLRQSSFSLYYQPQTDVDGRLTGTEALLRWRHSTRGIVAPSQFIPLAEDTGQILLLGEWVLDAACAQLAKWRENPQFAHISIAINVSVRQFRRHDFVRQVTKALERNHADPTKLKLELTESLLIEDLERTVIKMDELKCLGVSFSLDDFGTGYSSLAYLKRLPLDQLKIDQSFVRDILIDDNDAAIAKTIVNLGQSLGLTVVAEGVETLGQRDFLAAAGCTTYQGFLYGHPLPIEELEAAMHVNHGGRAPVDVMHMQ
jgi:EAL domain-containing protein (putative c-di-GMP-specific phosphodiesterase class I)